ncbi:multidrug resistance protein 1-like [Plakobranchus ocellatus]|uniref:Multidrug resistance protein 1-like n=1 Tax=Plakobranchus ocellatus TaxID=259542 RepID=A0AAV4DQR0_9GAST|nr:multidrug resistance protein 1-like [Plakobranchus ocellatus]
MKQVSTRSGNVAEFDAKNTPIELYRIVGGVFVILAAIGQFFFFVLSSERQIVRMRLAFYKNIMRQEMGWFDTNSCGEMTVKLTDDIAQIHDAIGDKLAIAIQYFAGAIFSWTVIFYYGWELALFMQIGAPFLIVSFAWMGNLKRRRLAHSPWTLEGPLCRGYKFKPARSPDLNVASAFLSRQWS